MKKRLWIIASLNWLLLAVSPLYAQKAVHLKSNQLASFMTEPGSISSLRYFIIETDGTLSTFTPGGKPQPYSEINNVKEICAGQWHILALKKDGTVWAWGSNRNFQLGNENMINPKGRGIDSRIPVQVTGITDAVSIAVFEETSYALLNDGTIMAWGYGAEGLTGDGEKIIPGGTTARISGCRKPVKVKGISNAIAISAAMALLNDGSVYTWGRGRNGRLGNGSTEPSSIPVKVKGIQHAVAISAYEQTCLALLQDGSIKAWGTNYKGQLGNGSKANGTASFSAVPVEVRNIRNAIGISAHAVCMAVLKDSTVMTWGWDEIGGLGMERGHNFNVPAKLPLTQKVISVQAGHGTGFALLRNGIWMGWGAQTVATGVYRESYKPVPVAVLQSFKK